MTHPPISSEPARGRGPDVVDELQRPKGDEIWNWGQRSFLGTGVNLFGHKVAYDVEKDLKIF
jgi:hypothetical protein